MGPHSPGHITACKISYANPNEMVVSWSGDHIYSFDIVRSKDARETTEVDPTLSRKVSTRISKRLKTKHSKHETTEAVNHMSSSPVPPESGNENSEMSFRVRYGNGESETVVLPPATETSHPSQGELSGNGQYATLTESQKLSVRIARAFVKLRKLMFSLDLSMRQFIESHQRYDATLFTSNFSEALGFASTYQILAISNGSIPASGDLASDAPP
jgi:nuclear receptor interaction protein